MIWCTIHCSDMSVDCAVGLSKEKREDCWQKSCVASFRVQRDRDRQRECRYVVPHSTVSAKIVHTECLTCVYVAFTCTVGKPQASEA